MNESEPQSAGQLKVAEYIARINGGEDADQVLAGLGSTMRQAVEAGVGVPEQNETAPIPEESSPEEVVKREQAQEQKREQEKAKLAEVRESLGMVSEEKSSENIGDALRTELESVSEKVSMMGIVLREYGINDHRVAETKEALLDCVKKIKVGIDQMLPTLRQRYKGDITIGNQLGLIKRALDALQSGDRRALDLYGGPNDEYSNRIKSLADSVKNATVILVKKFEAA